MDFKGVIIQESLKDISVLKDVKIVKTSVEKTTEKHRTPWLTQWTIHNIEISEDKIDNVCEKLQKALELEHEWYIDLKNNKYEITIFKNQISKKRIYNYNFN